LAILTYVKAIYVSQNYRMGDMYVDARISVSGDRKIFEAVEKALRPDNEYPPDNFIITTEVNGDTFNIKIKFEERGLDGRKLLTALSIINEVLELVKAFTETIKVIKVKTS
jgi:hypothetical protein